MNLSFETRADLSTLLVFVNFKTKLMTGGNLNEA